ncbi:MAG: hypothetical protein HYS12_26190 [Planctomycetes bacterium]|nr:hypothetical protein [Planctomycetota bacterium]
MRPTNPSVRRAVAALALLLAAGCGQDGPELAPVRGTVYHKGAPLKGGTIVFAPDRDRGCCGSVATASIRSDGTYVLRTGDADGATPGWHRITIAGSTAPGKSSALPHRYSEALPYLCREVVPGHENVIDLHLD